MVKKLFKTLGILVGGTIFLLLSFILFTMVTDYKPDDIVSLDVDQGSYDATLEKGLPYSIISFNTGYGGLGANQDFFMDGGSGSGAETLAESQNNTNAISDYLKASNADFVLLQEVDINSKRSQYVNQYNHYLTNYNRTFALNYKNSFVPVPLSSPMGKVESGLVTASKAKPKSADRYVFKGEENFIVHLFELDRNFPISRYPINDSELVIINAHFSAYDEGGNIRRQQLNQMVAILNQEYNAGHYVILGGDFNHELPGADSSLFTYTQTYPDWIQTLPADFTPNTYTWAIDPSTPTVRDLIKPYVAGENFVAVIDGFLVSNNIQVIEVKTTNLDFENSDHNPVVLQFILK